MLANFFGNILQVCFKLTQHYGISIVLFTLITKTLLIPLTISQTKSMSAMKRIQPEIDEINRKYKNNPQKQNEMLMAIYKKNKINPMAGCLPLLVQLPIIFAMFKVIKNPVLYVFNNNEALFKAADTGFLWIKSLSQPDVIKLGSMAVPFILPVATALVQYFQAKMSMAKSTSDNPAANSSQTMMLYAFPLMMLFWGVTFPAGLMLYWFISTVYQIIQQYFIGKIEEKESKKIA